MSDEWLKELTFGDGRTPRTDKLFRTNTEWLEFSRQLELELNEAIRDRKLWEANWEGMKSERDSLKVALREALDGWAYAINRVASENSSNIQADRIAELRAQFLDDK